MNINTAQTLAPDATLPLAAGWLGRADAGSEHWWRGITALGVPLLEPVGTAIGVSFLWRDAQALTVYIDVNGISDHHAPPRLQQLDGCDVWYWQTVLPAHWRGSYLLIPLRQALAATGRDWWRAALAHARPDPLNPLPPHAGSDGVWLSPLHLPQAPPQTAWQAPAMAAPAALDWDDGRGARRIWLYDSRPDTAPGTAPLPLVLLLDGQHWACRMPVFAALRAGTMAGQLPAALYVLLDSIDAERRRQDLCCSEAFWLALQQTLLPWLAARYPLSADPAHTVLAGQSLGGLAAMYAAQRWPQRFGAVLSQSGSFWWPDSGLLAAGTDGHCLRKPGSRGALASQVGPATTAPLRVFMEVGSREDVMLDVNLSQRDALLAAGHSVHYREFEGGHDWLCWRGGLLDGLRWLLAPPSPPKPGAHDE